MDENKVNANLAKFGENIVKQSKPQKWYSYFFASLFGPFNSILLGISAVLFYTDVILTTPPSYANILVIFILVATSTLLEFFEEYRSNRAAQKLSELVATTCKVVRDGKTAEIPLTQVTYEDTILLSAGDLIPADIRIIEAKDLYISQSALTGESDAVRKTDELEISKEKIESISDLNTICFMGTNVVSGFGKGIVIKVADDTYFGKIAHTITSAKPQTTFQKGIQNVSKLLMRFMLVMIPITFLINAWKHNTLTAFTFAVAIAIGITPLLLPVILSSSLAKGAVRMSRKKTIVKKLDSIQSFGAMNILCTDKTGTLTEDKIVLEKYLDVMGNEGKDVLNYAYLNAYFQAGLSGNIDEAIINRANTNNISNIKEEYTKKDEIPFDFSRRRLSVVLDKQGNTVLVTKGAVEEILSICTSFSYLGQIFPMTPDMRNKIKTLSKDLNREGLRVVAVCIKENLALKEHYTVSDESSMVLMGFTCFLDPPKASSKQAILRFKPSWHSCNCTNWR